VNRNLRRIIAVVICLVLQLTFVFNGVSAKSNKDTAKFKNIKSNERVVLVKYRDTVDKKQDKMKGKKNSGKVQEYKKFKNKNVYKVRLKKNKMNQLSNDPEIELIEDDSPVQVLDETFTLATIETGTDSYNNTNGDLVPWNIQRMKADELHDLNIYGDGVKIAVFDTGIDLGNNDMTVSGGTSFIEGVTSYDDDHGHGTAMAGILASQLNGTGLVGIAPGAEIYSVKVLDSTGQGTYSNLIEGIDWAINNGIDIITMSLGGNDFSQILLDVIQDANNNNILVIAAAGNNGEENILFPANFPETVCVGAIDSENIKTSMSNYGHEIDLVAPGENIETYGLNSTTAIAGGTSSAVQHVAGIASLLWSVDNNLTNGQIKFLLYQNTYILEDSEYYGYGITNAVDAYNNLINNDYTINCIVDGEVDYSLDTSLDVGGEGIVTAQDWCGVHTGCSADNGSTYGVNYYVYGSHNSTYNGHRKVRFCANSVCKDYHEYGCTWPTNTYYTRHFCTTCNTPCVYSNNCDASCNYTGCPYGNRVAPHDYTNDCDTTCNSCTATRSITHVDNNCNGTCDICSSSVTITHNWGSWGTIQYPKCYQDCIQQRTCSKCSLIDELIIPTTWDHVFSDWTITEPATCSSTGSRERSCENTGCSKEETETIDALGHLWTAATYTESAHPHERYKLCYRGTCPAKYYIGEQGTCTCHSCSYSIKTPNATHYSDGHTFRWYCSCGSSVSGSGKMIKSTCNHCTTPPTLLINNLSDDNILTELDLNYIPQIKLSDTFSDTLTCKYYINDVLKCTDSISTTSTLTTYSFSTGFNPNLLNDGENTIKVKVSDALTSKELTKTFYVDKTLPNVGTVSLSSSVNSVTISTSGASDATSGLATNAYRYTIGSTTTDWLTTAVYEKTSLQPNNEYSTKIEVKDAVGHINESTGSIYTKAEIPNFSLNLRTSTSLEIITSDDNHYATEYNIKVGTKYVTSSGALTTNSNTWITLTDKKINITGLSWATSYTIVSKARNGNSVVTNTQTISETTYQGAPETPVFVSSTTNTDSITITWLPASRASTYTIKVDGFEITDRTGTSYTHSSLGSGTQHTYQVKAVNVDDLESSYSSTSTLVTKTSNSWTMRANLPVNRREGASVELNGKIYYIGGTTDGQPSNEVYMYNPLNNTWTQKASIPAPRYSLSAHAVNGKIYALGGFYNGIRDNVYEYNPSTNIWSTVSSIPTNRQLFGSAVIGNKIYIVGGFNGGYINKLEIYDTEANVWDTNNSDIQTARYYLSASAVNGKLYAIGGKNSSGALDIVEEYNPTTDSWTQVQSINYERYWNQAVTVNGKIYIVGGKDNSGDYINKVEEYNPVQDTWIVKPSLPDNVAASALVEYDNELYSIGGTSTTSPFINTMYRYCPGISNPQIPANLTGTAYVNKIDLVWEPALEAEEYILEAYISGTWTEIYTGNNKVYSHTGLTQETEYSYRIKSKNSSGVYSSYSSTVSITTLRAAPDSAPVPSATSTANTVTLTWDPTGNTDGYKVKVDDTYTKDMGNPTLVNGKVEFTYDDTTFANDSSITPNTQYSFVTTSYNTSTTDKNSTEISIYTKANIPDNGNIISEDITYNSVEASWGANGNQAGTEYKLGAFLSGQSTPDNDSGWITSTSAVLTVNANTNYDIKVKARNSDNEETAWLLIDSITTKKTPPVAPSGLTTSNITYNSLELDWGDVTGAETYTIEVNKFSTGEITTITDITESNKTIDGLDADTLYEFRVKAINNGGESSYSTKISETTNRLKPDKPGNTSATAGNTSITVSWVITDRADGYKVYEIVNSVLVLRATKGIAETSYTHSSLIPGTKHEYIIRAYNESGESNYTQSTDKVSATTTLLTSTLSVTSETTDTTGLTWTTVTGNNVTYELWDTGNTSKIYDGSGTSYTHTGLSTGSQYTYKVIAKNSLANSPDSNIVTAVTKLDKPAGIVSTVRRDKIIIRWNAAVNATSYYIEVAGEGIIYDNITDTKCTVDGLSSDSTYTINLKAKNSVSESDNTVHTRTTLKPAPETPDSISLDINDISIGLSWNAATNADAYDIWVDGTIINLGNNMSYNHTGIIPGSNHEYKVRSRNNSGKSSWIETGVLIAEENINKPNLTANMQTDSIVLNWNLIDGFSSYKVSINGSEETIVTGNSYTHSTLTPSTVYSYKVRGEDGGNVTEWSNLVQVSTGIVEEPVANINATLSSEMITLIWDEIISADSYMIEIDDNAGDIKTSEDSYYIHEGLNPGTEYKYRVKAVYSTGEGEWSGYEYFTTDSNPPSVPVNIINTTMENSIELTWDSVQDASNYLLEIDGTAVETLSNEYYLHKGLVPDSEHTYRLASQNEYGQSEWSRSVVLRTKEIFTAPDTPCVTNAYISGNKIYFTWENVDDAVGYITEIDNDGALTPTKSYETPDGYQLEYEHVWNYTHKFRVYAFNSAGTSSWSEMIYLTAPMQELSKPVNLSAAQNINDIHITWETDGAEDECQLLINGSQSAVITKPAGNAYEYILENVSASTQYDFKVRSQNATGQSQWSSDISLVSLPEQVEILSVPENIVSYPSADSIILTWDNVTGATEYDVLVDGTTTETVSDSIFTLANCTEGNTYTFSIKAKNLSYEGDWTLEFSVTAEDTTTIVDPVEGITFDTEEYAVNITWNAYTGATGYEIMEDGITYTSATESYRHEGLLPAQQYNYKIRAVVGMDYSDWSQTYSVLTKTDIVDMPDGFYVTAQEEALTVNWLENTEATGYEVSITGRDTVVVLAGNTALTVGSLEAGTLYSIKMRTVKNTLYSDWTQTVDKVTKLSVPSNIQYTVSGNDITVTWDESINADEYIVDINGIWETGITTNSYTFTHDGLTEEYNIRIKAKNTVTQTDFSGYENIEPEQQIYSAAMLQNDYFDFGFIAENLEDGKVYTIEIEYDQNLLEVLDLCSFNLNIDRGTGIIENTNITVLEDSPGRIQFKVTIDPGGGQVFSGLLNSVRFNPLYDEMIEIKYIIREIEG
jgi:N-acetylneuraminic acid mutarotase